MMTRTLLWLLLCFISVLANAQASRVDEDHDHDHHDHHGHEIGIATSGVYFLKEKEFSLGLHIHYLYSIDESRFGLGAGYERIFDEHKHNTIGISWAYRPVDRLNLILSPGLTFEDNSDAAFALHFEITYEYPIGNLHIGPALEMAYDPEDYHISLGLHIGYGF